MKVHRFYTLWLALAVLAGCSGKSTTTMDAGPEASMDGAAADAEMSPDGDVDGGDGGPVTVGDFTRIVSGGIDDRLNGYPWAMELYDGDNDGTPEVYVGTVQNPLCLQAAFAEVVGLGMGEPPVRWQCRNDLWGNWVAFFAASATPGHVYRGRYDQDNDRWTWERVFSPALSETSGFRGARVFNGALYMLGLTQTGGVVWKTTDGETYERASPPDMATGGNPVAGGLRGAQVFMGRLHVANNGICEIYASADPTTDASSWEQVNSTGFVDSGGEVDASAVPFNQGIWQLGVFNGFLYAGTTNENGPELWKSDDPRPGNWTQVISGGFGNTVIQGYMTIRPFLGNLFLGTVLYPVGAPVMEGCDILRVDATDNVELLVGKTRDPGLPSEIAPLSGLDGGFDYPYNVYSWYMAEHGGYLYVGTYDSGSQVIDYAEALFGVPLEQWTEDQRSAVDSMLGTADRTRQGGSDLWRTADGVTWEPVNLDGFGDRDNYGIRNMLVTPWGFMVATGNAVDGFEIWLAP